MRHHTITDIVMAVATAAVFLFLFSLTLVPRSQLGAPKFDMAGVGHDARVLP
jgi:hypothetical protein